MKIVNNLDNQPQQVEKGWIIQDNDNDYYMICCDNNSNLIEFDKRYFIVALSTGNVFEDSYADSAESVVYNHRVEFGIKRIINPEHAQLILGGSN